MSLSLTFPLCLFFNSSHGVVEESVDRRRLSVGGGGAGGGGVGAVLQIQER